MADVEVEIQGLEALNAYFKQGSTRVRRSLTRALKVSAALAERSAKEEAPVDTGILRSSIYSRFLDDQAVVAPLANYALDVHEGRKPGPITGTDRQNLMKWATRKGLNPYAVVKSVEKKGTKGNPFMERAAERSASGIFGAFEQALTEIAEG